MRYGLWAIQLLNLLMSFQYKKGSFLNGDTSIGKRSSEIADIITEHPNTVREHLSRIRTKISNIIKTSNLEDLLRH